MKILALLFVAILQVTPGQSICSRFQAVPGRCDLNATAVEQAKCLLRPVKKFAHLGEPLRELPAPLDTLIGQSTETSVTLEQRKRRWSDWCLFYIVASVRSGKWLIPAYHSPVDLGYPDRHDDPQKFDLQTWTEKLNELIEAIGSAR